MKKNIKVHVLSRCDNRNISDDFAEIRLFATVRNELARLPHFFDYYRRLGVSRFFFVDNASTDGTERFLLEQEDCHVFHTTNSFSQGKVSWQNTLLDTFGAGHWCLIVDADELFVYPHCETVKLADFCRYLDQEKCEAVQSFLLDMYAEGNMANAVCVPAKSFTDICPYFDKDYSFLSRPCLPFSPKPYPPTEPIGGPRLRVFYSAWNKRTVWMQWKMCIYTKLGILCCASRSFPTSIVFSEPPYSYKVPFSQMEAWQCIVRTYTRKIIRRFQA